MGAVHMAGGLCITIRGACVPWQQRREYERTKKAKWCAKKKAEREGAE